MEACLRDILTSASHYTDSRTSSTPLNAVELLLEQEAAGVDTSLPQSRAAGERRPEEVWSCWLGPCFWWDCCLSSAPHHLFTLQTNVPTQLSVSPSLCCEDSRVSHLFHVRIWLVGWLLSTKLNSNTCKHLPEEQKVNVFERFDPLAVGVVRWSHLWNMKLPINQFSVKPCVAFPSSVMV